MFPKKVKRYFNLARNAAFNSNHQYRHGAVLIRGGAVFNVANNDSRFCSFGKRFSTKNKHPSTLHAELATILGISRSKTNGADIYVVRIGKSGEFRNSKPCNMCMNVCKFVGIRRIYYSVEGCKYGVVKCL